MKYIYNQDVSNLSNGKVLLSLGMFSTDDNSCGGLSLGK